MTKMDHISSRFRRSKKAAQAATSPSSPDQPSPDGSNGTSPISVTSVTAPTTMPATMPTTATTTAPVSSATSATSVPPGTQQPRHESPPALSISTTTPPGSGHSIPNNICDRSPNGNQGLRSTLHPPKSPFRNFHFRSSNKRARSPAPPTLAIPTPPAIVNHDGTIGHEMTSPLRYQPQQPPTNGGEMVVDKPKIPAFLTLSETEMTSKFREISYHEHCRLQQSIQNPSLNFRFAHALPAAARYLDRYANVQPWTNNRVKLQVPEGQVDYINASPIVLASPSASRPPLRYIAMQGPKSNTSSHAWRMVAEQLQSPAVIVMLTETHEGEFEKCFQYFPRSPDDKPLRINEHDGFCATVRCVEVEERAGGAIEARRLEMDIEIEDQSDEDARDGVKENEGNSQGQDEALNGNAVSDFGEDVEVEDKDVEVEDDDDDDAEVNAEDEVRDVDQMEVTNGETKKERKIKERRSMTVWHLLYRRWPDYGVPDVADMDSFFELMRMSREKNASADNPRVIHCSAGVGRSGTFMALEHLVRELESGDLENYDRDHGTTACHRPRNNLTAASPASAAGPVGPDLVFETVDRLREQRRMMVQAESQLVFIYTVLRKLWMDRYGVSATPTDAFASPGGRRRSSAHGHGHGNGNGNASGEGVVTPGGGDEPAAKRLEVDLNDPFVEV